MPGGVHTRASDATPEPSVLLLGVALCRGIYLTGWREPVALMLLPAGPETWTTPTQQASGGSAKSSLPKVAPEGDAGLRGNPGGTRDLVVTVGKGTDLHRLIQLPDGCAPCW